MCLFQNNKIQPAHIIPHRPSLTALFTQCSSVTHTKQILCFFNKKNKTTSVRKEQTNPTSQPLLPTKQQKCPKAIPNCQYSKDRIHSPKQNSWLSVELCLPNPFICSTWTTSRGENDSYVLLERRGSRPAPCSRGQWRCPGLAVTDLLPELGVIKSAPGSAAPRLINFAPIRNPRAVLPADAFECTFEVLSSSCPTAWLWHRQKYQPDKCSLHCVPLCSTDIPLTDTTSWLSFFFILI